MTRDGRILELTKENFIALRDLVCDRVGVFLTDSKYSFLNTRLVYRLQLLNLETVDDYLYFIKYNPRGQQELQELIEAIVINETFFFREKEHFQALAQLVLPESKLHLRIWSCGCSTGEEAYSLAATAVETLPNERRRRIDILGTDVSNKALESARRGNYTEQALREVSLRQLRRYFDKSEIDTYRVKKDLRELVTFERLNVMDTAGVAKLGAFDVIFCRNVLMYMDQPGRHKALVNLYQALKSGGWLFLGKSESALGAAGLFEIGHWGSVIYYRKPVIEQRAAG